MAFVWLVFLGCTEPFDLPNPDLRTPVLAKVSDPDRWGVRSYLCNADSMLERIAYDNGDMLELEYNEEGQLISVISDLESLESTQSYIYKNDELVEISSSQQQDSLSRHTWYRGFVWQQGHIVEYKVYSDEDPDSDYSLVKRKYEEGNLVEEEIFDPEGKLWDAEQFEYDEMKNPFQGILPESFLVGKSALIAYHNSINNIVIWSGTFGTSDTRFEEVTDYTYAKGFPVSGNRYLVGSEEYSQTITFSYK